jgi:DNA repair exonuclease SbcCD ATPase subunit
VTAHLKRLEVEGFRGFALPQSIDLDADVVLVRGDNGTGKTSLVDSFLWLFCGELEHLKERVRGLRLTEDVVTSRFKPGGARVSLTLDVAGREQIFTRTGDMRSTHLIAEGGDSAHVEGAQAEAQLAAAFGITHASDLARAVTTWGLLRQDAVRAALDETGGALHQRVSGLIGLERVSAFASATTHASNTLIRDRTAARASREQADKRHKEAVQRRDAASHAAGSAADVATMLGDGLNHIKSRLAPFARLITPEPVELATIAPLEEAVRAVSRDIDSLIQRKAAVARFPDQAEQLLSTAEQAAGDAERAAAEATERAPALVQLASAAIDLLGDTCPVCEQPIEAAAVRTHLRDVLDSSRAVAEDAQRSQDALVTARSDLARIRGVLAELRAAEGGFEEARKLLDTRLGQVDDRIRPTVDFDGEGLGALGVALSSAATALRDLSRTVSHASGAEVSRLSDEATEATQAADSARNQVEEIEKRCARAKVLERAAHAAAEEILRDALERLRPSFAEVFDRLTPNPAFTELLARQDVVRNRNQIVPMVRDQERGIDANPLLVFSEGQLNVVALSYFLGMALNAREAALPFLLLDDPLQALDVVAILSFSDLCRHIRSSRQLLLTTHDRRFADVLVRKLSPRDPDQTLIIHDFEGWTRNGPVIRTERPAVLPVMRLLHRKAS